MRRALAWTCITMAVACGGGRDAWTGVNGGPPEDLTGQEPRAEPVSTSAASLGPAGPLRPDDLDCGRPWSCRPLPRWQNRRREDIKARLGRPFFESATEWHYMVRREGCRAPSQRLVFHWPGGRVHFKWSRGDLACFGDLALPEREPEGELSRLEGKGEVAVLGALGVPDYAEEGQWIYRVPDGCAEERDVTTVLWSEGSVRSVRREHVFTGEHCEPISL